jgi:acyl-CoA thioesterase FadM
MRNVHAEVVAEGEQEVVIAEADTRRLRRQMKDYRSMVGVAESFEG